MSGVVPGDLGIRSLMIDGESIDADLAEAITTAEVERTIEGASTVAVAFHDAHRRILRSGLLSARATTQLDAYSFELAQTRKSGSLLQTTWEDLAVAALRRHTDPVKVEAGTTTRVEFARRLVAEEPWIEFIAPIDSDRTNVELARGNPDAEDETTEREDSWAALGRILDEIGWRRFSLGSQVWVLPETFLYLGDPIVTLREHDGPVDLIDFDHDVGKPVATATVSAHAARWFAGPGSIVAIEGCGPADGKWLVAGIRRSLFTTLASIDLAQPRPTLPEPVADTSDSGDVESGSEGDASVMVDEAGFGEAGADAPTRTPGPWIWPTRTGGISSRFGWRNGRLHAGVDIAVPVGTTVYAAKSGVVEAAEGGHGGYGNLVIINHGGSKSRYGHLSKIDCRRGQQVRQGIRIGLSGGARGAPGAGNSSGPHLHFEIRPGDKPANPLQYLPGSSPRGPVLSQSTMPL